MKKVLLLFVILQVSALYLFSLPGGDRKRFFLIAGGGYASSYPGGPLLEAGVEVRLLGNIHIRLMLNHNTGDSEPRGNEIMNHMNSITLYGIYRMRLSERIDFRIKLGGHYSALTTEMTAFGITFTASRANVGIVGGTGFSMQLGNNLYTYIEGTAKYLMFEEPWTWAEIQVGMMFRLR